MLREMPLHGERVRVIVGSPNARHSLHPSRTDQKGLGEAGEFGRLACSARIQSDVQTGPQPQSYPSESGRLDHARAMITSGMCPRDPNHRGDICATQ